MSDDRKFGGSNPALSQAVVMSLGKILNPEWMLGGGRRGRWAQFDCHASVRVQSIIGIIFKYIQKTKAVICGSGLEWCQFPRTAVASVTTGAGTPLIL